MGLPGSLSPGKPWPEREPLLGFKYDGNSLEVVQQHIDWAADYGIDFFIFDWWWTDQGKPRSEEALQKYLQAPNQHRLKFCLIWCNKFMPIPCNREIFQKAVAYWLDHFFKNPQYVTIEEQPVVFIFSPMKLQQGAKASNTTIKEYLIDAKKMATQKGFKGIYFVACSQPSERLVMDLPNQGYSAVSAYHYPRIFSWKDGESRIAKSFEDLLAGYRESWSWMLGHSPLPYLLPITAGLDMRPVGHRGRNLIVSGTPESFETMLRAGKEMMDRYPDKTKRTGVVCAWNEFTEGAYIEPTKKWGFQYLEKIKQVFGK